MSRMACFGKSDIGLKRKNNEDAFLADPQLEFCLVADGMGGAEAGELASHIFADTARKVFSEAECRSLRNTPACIQQSFVMANREILAHIAQHPHHKGMGCTAELLALSPEGFALGHMGDSRTYRFRDGQLKQLTRDHSLVQDQVARGLITPEEARRHPMRHVILRAVGIETNPALDLVSGRITPGDLFLLCSDGLTDLVSDARIEEILACSEPLSRRTDLLIAAALAGGGSDNVTVVLCEHLK